MTGIWLLHSEKTEISRRKTPKRSHGNHRLQKRNPVPAGIGRVIRRSAGRWKTTRNTCRKTDSASSLSLTLRLFLTNERVRILQPEEKRINQACNHAGTGNKEQETGKEGCRTVRRCPVIARNRRSPEFLVPETGIEPVRHFWREILSLLCLPISPPGRWTGIVTDRSGETNGFFAAPARMTTKQYSVFFAFSTEILFKNVTGPGRKSPLYPDTYSCMSCNKPRESFYFHTIYH